MRPEPPAMPCRRNDWRSHARTAAGRHCGSCSPHEPRQPRPEPRQSTRWKALILGAPDDLRRQLPRLTTPRQPLAEPVLRGELRRLATHIRAWDPELRANKAQLRQLVAQTMPALLEQPGVGPMSAAQLLVSWSHKGDR